jgi:hypothetical protein
MKIAVNNEVRIPIIRVVAKPCTGPVPFTNNTTPTIMVVTLASIIDD